MPLLSKLGYIGLGKETTQGTAVAATAWLPVTKLGWTDDILNVQDDSFYGSVTEVRGLYQTTKSSTVMIEGWCYLTSFPNLLVAAGFADTVTGSGPYTHTMKATSSQPPSYTFTVFTNVETRYVPGCVLDSITLTYDLKGVVSYSATFKGWPSTSTTTVSPSFDTSLPFPTWNTAVNIGGTAVTRLLEFSLTTGRGAEVIPTMSGLQTPYDVWGSQLKADAKLKAIVENDTDWNEYINNTQPPMVLTSTAASTHTMEVSMGDAAWTTAPWDFSGSYVELSADIVGVNNSTDSGPCSFIVANTQSTAY